jgi:uncharacterized Zn finger protein
MARYYDDWQPYVPVATRRWEAARELLALRKNGHTVSPVHINGRKIATTFWGRAWCDNLERYSDFANRLPRGRTYVRNGSVVDLQIARGTVTALVSGSDLYRIRIGIKAVPKARWQGICRDCSGAIDSLVELLQGRLSAHMMNRICEPNVGLFPEPRDVSFECSCPDWAWMCKHVAATLYGVGARFDERPDLLFLLRGVDQEDLIAKAGTGPAVGTVAAKVLDSGDLSGIFGIEMAEPGAPPRTPTARRPPKPKTKITAPAASRAEAARPRAAKRLASGPVRASGPNATTSAKPVAAAGPRAPARVRLTSAKMRKAVSERMKKY